MEPAISTEEPLPSAVSQRVQFQSIEDFEKEQDALDELKATEADVKAKLQPPTKKQKKQKTVDLEVLAIEAQAMEEIGDVNWVGRLLGLPY